jgi:hypothetical protein
MELKPETVRFSRKPPRYNRLFNCYYYITWPFTFIKKYTMGKIKENWAWVLFITFLAAFLTFGFQIIYRSCDRQASAAESSASVPFVEQKCVEIKDYINRQDGDLKNYIDVQDGQAAERMNRIQVDMSKKADKDDFDKVYQKCEENNKLSIEILKMLKENEK